MKNLVKFLTLSAFCFLSINIQAQETKVAVTGKPAIYAHIEATRTAPRSIEKTMLDEINMVRMDPKGYIKYVKEHCKKHGPAETHPAVVSLISDLNGMTPIKNKLKPSDCLYLAARDHSVDQAPTGDPEHYSQTTKTNPWDRVKKACGNGWSGNENLAGFGAWPTPPNDARRINMILLIDSGIPGYGHRKNILQANWTHSASFYFKYVDNSNSQYKDYGNWHWVQKFGDEKGGSAPATGGSANNSSNAGNTGGTPATGTKPTVACPGSASGVRSDFDGNWYLTTSNGEVIVKKDCACKHFPAMCK